MQFEPVRVSDIDQIVEIIKDVQLGFLSRMPKAFIRRYLGNILHSPSWYCRVLREQDTVLGFHITIVGRGIARSEPLMKNPIYFALLAAIFVVPALIILNYFISERRIATLHQSLRDKYDAELVYIAVHPGHQNRGLGRLFMADMRSLLETNGVSILGTEYYRDDPQAARFYGKYKFEKLAEINTGGRVSVSLRFNVSDLPQAEK